MESSELNKISIIGYWKILIITLCVQTIDFSLDKKLKLENKCISIIKQI